MSRRGRARSTRRRFGRLIATLALLLAPLAVGAAAYLSFAPDGASGGAPRLPIAMHTPPVPSSAAEPREPEVAGRPVPGVALASVDAFHLYLRKPPRAGLVFDVGSGEVLWRRDPLRVLPVASLTKIMTALVVVEHSRPAEPVRITQAALDYTGAGVGLLPKGRRVRLEALLNGLLIVSGNDAAIALAVHESGSERRFVGVMNRRAREWGLRCTHFASSHGLEPGNRSCARDLAVLTRLAMARPRIRRIARRSRAALRFPIKGGKLYLSGHNPLMRMGYAGAIGLKTGYTDAAGRCFVGVARRAGRRLGVVLLDSPDPAKHAPKLLDAGFASDG
ncbi:MAG: D-alanyl-D-alanine carboxypeptidase [Thermoleophilaceae bacterium]|nr:D-alanyl-D-alanine carboxypeptidase [Thermoleophilaceae bacterium]